VSRTQNGAWQGTYRVRASRSGSGTAMAAFGSMGTAASRWFTKRARTTTSAPSRAMEGCGQGRCLATLLPWSGNRSGAPSWSAASGSTTVSSGS
jgi:hypothetical protein